MQSWYNLKKALRMGGGVVLLGAIGVIIATWKSPHLLKPLTALVAMVAIVLPTLSKVAGAAYPAALSRTEPTLTVRLPLDEPTIVTWGGDRVKTNYHAATPEQRWAYDLVVAPHGLSSSDLTQYGCFGVTVLAPISGRVIKAVDEYSDQIPGQLSAHPSSAFGNHIMIEPPSGIGRVLIAHLKSGSVTVTVDQQVVEGAAIGQCGNSGNSSEPHIHIDYGVQQKARNGLYYTTGLPLYFRDHGGEPMPTGGFGRKGKDIIWRNQGIQHTP